MPGTGDAEMNDNCSLPQTGGVVYVKKNVEAVPGPRLGSPDTMKWK